MLLYLWGTPSFFSYLFCLLVSIVALIWESWWSQISNTVIQSNSLLPSQFCFLRFYLSFCIRISTWGSVAIIIWSCFLIIRPKSRKMVSFPTPAWLNLSRFVSWEHSWNGWFAKGGTELCLVCSASAGVNFGSTSAFVFYTCNIWWTMLLLLTGWW